MDFEEIEIVDKTNPYMALLGINWAFENNSILNLKNRKMSFESDTMRLFPMLDPCERKRYTKTVREELETK